MGTVFELFEIASSPDLRPILCINQAIYLVDHVVPYSTISVCRLRRANSGNPSAIKKLHFNLSTMRLRRAALLLGQKSWLYSLGITIVTWSFIEQLLDGGSPELMVSIVSFVGPICLERWNRQARSLAAIKG